MRKIKPAKMGKIKSALTDIKKNPISKQELLDQNPDFNGTLYVDGDWIKKGWKKKFETLIGRELTIKEW